MALDTLALDYVIGLETPRTADRVIELTDRVFGPGRYTKTAERLREGSEPVHDLSFAATTGPKGHERLMGSVRMWPIFIYDEDANVREPLVFLGPIVVEPTHRGLGIGKSLVRASVDAAFQKGLRAVLLVGSQSYFKPFGFNLAEGIDMPGPVDAKRVLIRYRDDGLHFHGRVVKVI
ncbi:GNAT family N-acetyltransferase [Asticcacaulis biprosthecium]|uniref:GNAT family N-acetyltransferase n=1 Tax=Asticcacaulis biprosthecium TaxID=76891 RepID=UPI00058B7B14|nr:N-acetyltransferase [Asticcacaulis biprosthecium]